MAFPRPNNSTSLLTIRQAINGGPPQVSISSRRIHLGSERRLLHGARIQLIRVGIRIITLACRHHGVSLSSSSRPQLGVKTQLSDPWAPRHGAKAQLLLLANSKRPLDLYSARVQLVPNKPILSYLRKIPNSEPLAPTQRQLSVKLLKLQHKVKIQPSAPLLELQEAPPQASVPQVPLLLALISRQL